MTSSLSTLSLMTARAVSNEICKKADFLRRAVTSGTQGHEVCQEGGPHTWRSGIMRQCRLRSKLRSVAFMVVVVVVAIVVMLSLRISFSCFLFSRLKLGM